MRRDNNFDLLRLLAALAVVLTHAISLAMGSDRFDPLDRFTQGQLTFGVAGVYVFFIMSGYLVTQSWHHRPNAARFLQARFLRIYPLLTVIVLLSMVVLGPLVSTSASYWTEPRTWGYLRVLLLHEFPQTLPGVFQGGWVNGPLWTMWYEVGCYVLLAVAGATRVLERRTMLVLFTVLCAQYWFAPEMRSNEWLSLGRAFLAGVLVYLFRENLRFTRQTALLAILIFFLAIPEGLVQAVTPFSLATLVFYVAFHPRFRVRWLRHADVSYGLYLMHWPVQMLLLHFVPESTWYMLLGASLVICAPLALLSWRYLEAPALRYKDHPLPALATFEQWGRRLRTR